ncbi:MAG TPA: PsiF family protein [Rudaea sp.]
MKFVTSLVALTFAAVIGTGSAFAADAPAKPLTPQQQKMSDCSKQGHEKGLTGADYKSFMSTCLKGGDTAAAKPMTQQEKMKVCNTQAGEKKLTGDERKTFMSTCLKGDGSAAAAAH